MTEKEPKTSPNSEEALIEWNRYRDELIDLRLKMQELAVEKYGYEGYEWWQNKIVDFTKKIEKEKPDFGEYIAWHALIGSSSDCIKSQKLDLPEPYNIKDFFQSVIRDFESSE